MRVLVRINMRDGNPRSLKFTDLSDGLGLNFSRVKIARYCSQGEVVEAIAKQAFRIGKRRYERRVRHRHPIHQHYMASNAQLRRRLGQSDGIVERRTVGHQRGGSHDALAVRLDDGAIDAGREPKIIRIDDQAPHAPV